MGNLVGATVVAAAGDAESPGAMPAAPATAAAAPTERKPRRLSPRYSGAPSAVGGESWSGIGVSRCGVVSGMDVDRTCRRHRWQAFSDDGDRLSNAVRRVVSSPSMEG